MQGYPNSAVCECGHKRLKHGGYRNSKGSWQYPCTEWYEKDDYRQKDTDLFKIPFKLIGRCNCEDFEESFESVIIRGRLKEKNKHE